MKEYKDLKRAYLEYAYNNNIKVKQFNKVIRLKPKRFIKYINKRYNFRGVYRVEIVDIFGGVFMVEKDTEKEALKTLQKFKECKDLKTCEIKQVKYLKLK